MFSTYLRLWFFIITQKINEWLSGHSTDWMFSAANGGGGGGETSKPNKSSDVYSEEKIVRSLAHKPTKNPFWILPEQDV